MKLVLQLPRIIFTHVRQSCAEMEYCRLLFNAYFCKIILISMRTKKWYLILRKMSVVKIKQNRMPFVRLSWSYCLWQQPLVLEFIILLNGRGSTQIVYCLFDRRSLSHTTACLRAAPPPRTLIATRETIYVYTTL